MAARFAETGWSQGLINLKTRKWNGSARLAKHKLREPLGWLAPSTVFTNSMSDLFYEGFSNEEIAAVFGVMAATPRHTYLILTKRPDRMRAWFEWVAPVGKAILDRVTTTGFPPHPRKLIEDAALETLNGIVETIPTWRDGTWPLRNVWLGVSVENQAAADGRIPDLLATPAALRFLSCEPLLGALNLRRWLPLTDNERHLLAHGTTERSAPRVAWVIDGCESGPGARPAEDAWFASLEEQCRAAGVPYFHKQEMVNGRLEHDLPHFVQEFPLCEL